MKKILLIASLLITFIVPVLVQAQAPELKYSAFVRCDGVVNKTGAEPQRQKECNLYMLMETIMDVVSWLFYISIPITVALFSYAGILYMTGSQGNIKKAKSIFASVAIGFIIMCTGWIVVKTFVGYIVKEDNPYATTFLK